MRLDTDHMKAADSVSTKPTSVICPGPWPWAVAIMTSPINAAVRPSHWAGRAFSPSRGAASSRVKNACVCITTEAMPAVMPSCKPRNRKPNCPRPWARP